MAERVFGRLLPAPPTTVTAREAYADPARRPHDGRPWLVVGMIASVDGATAVEGRSEGLGGPGDKAVFRALRDLADVILVGAGTARAERYGPPTRPGQRIAVVTASGRLDGLDALMASGSALVITTETTSIAAAGVEVVHAGADRVDIGGALHALAERGARVVVAEGGPSLNGVLIAAGVVDEMCVTTAPMLAAGESRRLAHDPSTSATMLRLAHVLCDDEGFVFSRWLIDPPPALSPRP